MSKPREKKQYWPIPEEPRPGKKVSKHKRFMLERKIKPEHVRTDWLFRLLRHDPNRWDNDRSYEKLESAMQGMRAHERQFYFDRFDYRVIDLHDGTILAESKKPGLTSGLSVG